MSGFIINPFGFAAPVVVTEPFIYNWQDGTNLAQDADNLGDAGGTTNYFNGAAHSSAGDRPGSTLFCDCRQSGEYVTTTGFSTVNLGTKDFTLEAWVFAIDFALNDQVCLRLGTNGSGTSNVIELYTGPNGRKTWRYRVGSTTRTDTNHFFNEDQWYNVAIVRSGDDITMYEDGGSIATDTLSASEDLGDVTSVDMGGTSSITDSRMFIDDWRLTVGSALYSASYTPPTTYTA